MPRIGAVERDGYMATKSILKNVSLKGDAAVRRLVRALESARKKTSKPVTFQRSVSEATREDIRKMFGHK